MPLRAPIAKYDGLDILLKVAEELILLSSTPLMYILIVCPSQEQVTLYQTLIETVVVETKFVADGKPPVKWNRTLPFCILKFSSVLDPCFCFVNKVLSIPK